MPITVQARSPRRRRWRGCELARSLRDEFFSLRHEVATQPKPMQACITEALALEGRPVTIADTADNTGGGAAEDVTLAVVITVGHHCAVKK